MIFSTQLRPALQRAAVPALASASGLIALQRMAAAWRRTEDLNHGWAIGCFLVWWLLEAWRTRPESRPPAADRIVTVFLSAGLAAAVALARLALTPYPLWPAALWIYVGGTCAWMAIGLWRCGGWPWVRHFSFGTLLVAAALPWPGIIERNLLGALQRGLADATAEILNRLGQPAIAEGTALRIGPRWLEIDEACAGLRSIHLLLGFSLFAGAALYLGPKRRWLLVGLAAATAMGANLGRIVTLAWRQANERPNFNAWHDVVGYVAVGASLALVAGVAWVWRGPAFAAIRTPSRPAPGQGRRTWAALVGVLVAIEVGNFAWFHHPTSAWQADWSVDLTHVPSGYTEVPLTAEATRILEPDVYRGGRWLAADGSLRLVFNLEWRQGQQAAAIPFEHNPAICFPYSGCHLVRTLEPVSVRVGAHVVPFTGWLFERAGQSIVAYTAIWDVTRHQSLVDQRPAAGWMPWLQTRWETIASRRAETKVQMLTFTAVGSPATDALPATAAAELATLIRPAPRASSAK